MRLGAANGVRSSIWVHVWWNASLDDSMITRWYDCWPTTGDINSWSFRSIATKEGLFIRRFVGPSLCRGSFRKNQGNRLQQMNTEESHRKERIIFKMTPCISIRGSVRQSVDLSVKLLRSSMEIYDFHWIKVSLGSWTLLFAIWSGMKN